MAHAALREGVPEQVVVRDRALFVVLRAMRRKNDTGEKGTLFHVGVNDSPRKTNSSHATHGAEVDAKARAKKNRR